MGYSIALHHTLPFCYSLPFLRLRRIPTLAEARSKTYVRNLPTTSPREAGRDVILFTRLFSCLSSTI